MPEEEPREYPSISCMSTLLCVIYNLTDLRGEVIYPYIEFYAHIHVHVCTYTFPHTSSSQEAASALSDITVTEAGPAVLCVLQLQCSQPERSQQSCLVIWLRTSPVKKIIPGVWWACSLFGVNEGPYGFTLLSQQHQDLGTSSHPPA